MFTKLAASYTIYSSI